MNLQTAIIISILLPTSLFIVACAPESGNVASGSGGTGGPVSSGGSASGGNGTGGTIGTTGGATTGGATAAGGASIGTGGTAPGGSGSGSGGRGVGGAIAGTGGFVMGGSGVGSGGNGGGLVPTTGTASLEDEGADCVVAALPDVGSLPAIAKLPDPFKKLDGTRMSTKAEWRCRRQEIRKLAETFAYGTKPAKPQSVTGSVTSTKITINVTDNGKSTTFSADVKLPTGGSAPYPAIVVYGGASVPPPLDSTVINSEGIAIINYDPYDVGKETGARSPKSGAFYSIAGANSTTGLLVAWGWGVSRIIDVIAGSDGKILKADAVGVTGCSRFGKGSLVAGVFDQRIALTMPIESGSAGVPIWRGIPGEGAQSLSSAYSEQPWFGDAFTSFTGSPTKAPIDTHESLAMIAPRGLFIMDNPHIANLGPKSAHVAALAGAEAYKALGAGDNITYHSDVQNGTHCSVRPEWVTPLKENIQKFLKKTGNAPGLIKAHASATGKLTDWSDWTTPPLN